MEYELAHEEFARAAAMLKKLPPLLERLRGFVCERVTAANLNASVVGMQIAEVRDILAKLTAPKKGDVMADREDRFDRSDFDSRPAAKPVKAVLADESQPYDYIVQPGDTLERIAAKWLGARGRSGRAWSRQIAAASKIPT